MFGFEQSGEGLACSSWDNQVEVRTSSPPSSRSRDRTLRRRPSIDIRAAQESALPPPLRAASRPRSGENGRGRSQQRKPGSPSSPLPMQAQTTAEQDFATSEEPRTRRRAGSRTTDDGRERRGKSRSRTERSSSRRPSSLSIVSFVLADCVFMYRSAKLSHYEGSSCRKCRQTGILC